jgi:hypothetical protein
MLTCHYSVFNLPRNHLYIETSSDIVAYVFRLQEGNDVGNKQLTLDEFRIACMTLTSAYAKVEIGSTTVVIAVVYLLSWNRNRCRTNR